MHIIGIIAEYNPFHLGHLYQINKVKKMYPDSLIIVLVSTHFTQRGDISILNKWDKARICLDNKIDLVIEFPTLYATQSSDIFASVALSILNELKVDTLVFGTESDNLDNLIALANVQLDNKEYDKLVNKYLSLGLNYPTATSKALYELTKIKIDKPNDILGLSYIKEIYKNNYKITPISIKRTNDYHAEVADTEVVSANLIRKLYLSGQDITRYIPRNCQKYLTKAKLSNAYPLLRYKIITTEDLASFISIDEGIENRILKYLNTSHSWSELVTNTKTKRYTYNKINRMFIHILLNHLKIYNNSPLYIRILGFNNNGRKYLSKIKRRVNLPIITAYKKGISTTLDLEFLSTYIYSIITNNDNLITLEYQKKPIIKDDTREL